MRATTTRELSGPSSELTVGDVRKLIDGYDDDNPLRVRVQAGDRPFDSDQVTLEVTDG